MLWGTSLLHPLTQQQPLHFNAELCLTQSPLWEKPLSSSNQIISTRPQKKEHPPSLVGKTIHLVSPLQIWSSDTTPGDDDSDDDVDDSNDDDSPHMAF